MRISQLLKLALGDPDWEPKYVIKVRPAVQRHRKIVSGSRGVGITRKNKDQSKKRRKMAKASRRRNRK